MERALNRRRQALETVFFLKQDAVLREQQRLLEHKKHTRKTMAAISGINNERIIEELMALEVSPADVAALAMAPLVAVAWADGTVQDNERHQPRQRQTASSKKPRPLPCLKHGSSTGRRKN